MYNRFKIALVLCGILFAMVLFLLSPFFYVKDVLIYGCENITTSEIEMRTGVGSATNLLLFNTADARRAIMENLYIDDVTFQKQLPSTLTVTIRERRLSGYVEYMQGQYLYIDENGRVLEINSYTKEKLPVVAGFNFTRVRLGELLEVENAATFKTVVTYARLLNKYLESEMVSRIDVSNGDSARIMVYHIEFNVGDSKNADEKVRTIKEIIDNLPNVATMKGFVDLKDISQRYYFKILS